MSMTVNGVELTKGVEILNGAIKLANNLSEKKNQPRPEKKVVQESTNTSTNQPHTQTVEVKLGDMGQGGQIQKKPWEKDAKPVIIKPFPEGRELSERECAVEKLRLEQDHELKMKELEFRIAQEENARKERKEKEEYERKERERRREEAKRANRRFAIGAGVVGAISLGLIGWSMCMSSRSAGSAGRALSEPAAGLNMANPAANTAVTGEGTVE